MFLHYSVLFHYTYSVIPPVINKSFCIQFQNFIIAHEKTSVNNAILSFRKGHPFLKFLLGELVANFDAKKWGNQGPTRLTTCVKKYCNLTATNVKGTPTLEGELCAPNDDNIGQDRGFSILNRTAGYGVSYAAWHKFYQNDGAKFVEEMTKESFAVHYWNYMRVASKKIALAEHQPLYKIYKANCPVTEEHLLRNLTGSPY